MGNYQRVQNWLWTLPSVWQNCPEKPGEHTQAPLVHTPLPEHVPPLHAEKSSKNIAGHEQSLDHGSARLWLTSLTTRHNCNIGTTPEGISTKSTPLGSLPQELEDTVWASEVSWKSYLYRVDPKRGWGDREEREREREREREKEREGSQREWERKCHEKEVKNTKKGRISCTMHTTS